MEHTDKCFSIVFDALQKIQGYQLINLVNNNYCIDVTFTCDNLHNHTEPKTYILHLESDYFGSIKLLNGKEEEYVCLDCDFLLKLPLNIIIDRIVETHMITYLLNNLILKLLKI